MIPRILNPTPSNNVLSHEGHSDGNLVPGAVDGARQWRVHAIIVVISVVVDFYSVDYYPTTYWIKYMISIKKENKEDCFVQSVKSANCIPCYNKNAISCKEWQFISFLIVYLGELVKWQFWLTLFSLFNFYSKSRNPFTSLLFAKQQSD